MLTGHVLGGPCGFGYCYSSQYCRRAPPRRHTSTCTTPPPRGTRRAMMTRSATTRTRTGALSLPARRTGAASTAARTWSRPASSAHVVHRLQARRRTPSATGATARPSQATRCRCSSSSGIAPKNSPARRKPSVGWSYGGTGPTSDTTSSPRRSKATSRSRASTFISGPWSSTQRSTPGSTD
jgi:hypothetical protein